MKRILFLIAVVFSSFANATAFVDEMPFYVYGDVEMLASVLNAVAMIANSTEVEIIMGFVSTWAIWLGVRGLYVGGTFKPAVHNVMFLTLGGLLFGSNVLNVDVHIYDERRAYNSVISAGPTFKTVGNVPYVIGALGSFTTTLTSAMTKLVDAAFSPVQDSELGMSQAGFMQGQKTLYQIMKHLDFDKNSSLYAHSQDFTQYIEECAITKAVANDRSLMQKITNPQTDILESISPASLGITGPTFQMDDGITVCETFYNTKIKAIAPSMGTALEGLAQSIGGDMDLSNIYDSLGLQLGAQVETTIMAGATNKFQNFLYNYATIRPINRALKNTTMGLNISGQSLANDMTSAQSKAMMISEGAGQMKWYVDILPYAIHFMRGIIYGISVFVLMIAVLAGWEIGSRILASFMKSVFVFELINVSMALVNAVTMQYAQKKAADQLAFLGQNPVSVGNLPDYLDYMATMTGVAGSLGIAAIIAIPTMVFKGDVSALMGGMSALAGRYLGNSIQNARQTEAKNAGTNSALGAIQNDADAQRYFSDRGMEMPNGIGALEYYNMYQRSMGEAGAGAASLAVNANASEYSKGTFKQAAGQIGSTVGYNDNIGSNQAFNAGIADGGQKAVSSAVRADGAVTDGGITSDFKEGTRLSAVQQLASTNEMGGTMSTGEAITMGRDQAKQTVNKARGLTKSQAYQDDGSDGAEAGKYESGIEFNSRNFANKTMGAGAFYNGRNDSEQMDDFAKIQKAEGLNMADMVSMARAKSKYAGVSYDEDGRIATINNTDGKTFTDSKGNTITRGDAMENIEMSKNDSMLGQGAGIRENRMGSGSNNIYAQNAEYGEMSKQQSTASKIAAQGGVTGAVATDVADAALKAGEQKASIQAKSERLLEESGAGSAAKEMAKGIVEGSKEAGENLKKALGEAMELAGNQSTIKTSQDLGSTHGLMNIANNGDMIKKSLDKAMDGKDDEQKQAILNDAKELGLLNSDGSVASTGSVLSAFSQAKTGNMSGMHGLVLGGERLDLSADATKNGNARVSTDSSEKNTYGKSTHNTTGLKIDAPAQAALHSVDEYLFGDSFSQGTENIVGSTIAGVATAAAADQVLSGGKGRQYLHNKGASFFKSGSGGDVGEVGSYDGSDTRVSSNSTYEGPDGKERFADPAGPPDGKGRIARAMDAIEGGGSWKTKLGLASSALILGSQSETFANTLEMLDPSSFLTGTSIGMESDLDWTKNRPNPTSGGGIEDLKNEMSQNHMMNHSSLQSTVSASNYAAENTEVIRAGMEDLEDMFSKASELMKEK